MKKIKLEKYDVNLFKLIFPRVDYDSIVFINTIEEIMCVRDACNEFLDHSEDKLEVEKHEQNYDKAFKECKESTVTAQYVKSKKEQQEDKPKKLKYVYACKECLGGEPCKLKVYGSTAHPNTCPLEKSKKANWKLKKEGA